MLLVSGVQSLSSLVLLKMLTTLAWSELLPLIELLPLVELIALVVLIVMIGTVMDKKISPFDFSQRFVAQMSKKLNIPVAQTLVAVDSVSILDFELFQAEL